MTQQSAVYNPGVAAPFATAARWLKAWVTIGTLVVLVVIGYLLAIVNALQSIDNNLATTDTDVSDITADVLPLEGHVENINATLASIDTVLLEIPEPVLSIINSLNRIEGTLQSIDPTLGSINSGLVTALNGLTSINATLRSLDEPGADNKGLKPIISQVQVINNQLASVRDQDTVKIEVDLTNVNDGVAFHVKNICNATSGSRRCGI